MEQSISNQFRVALTHLLAREGRGAQTRLSSQQKIDRGYLNAIVKGRKSGSEEIRSKIANHFNLAYEEMFILGRRILEGGGEPDLTNVNAFGLSTTDKFPVFQTSEDDSEFETVQKTEEVAANISDKILKVIEILKSGTSYADSLAGQIDTFHEAISTEEENRALKNKLSGMESRIASLEKNLDGKQE
ncbi:MAG: hypothetical protein WBB19_14165 [Desulforhopalus sp.]